MDNELRAAISYPLSPIQAGIVYESLISSRPIYLQQHILTIHESINHGVLQAALDIVAARHPVLRTAIQAAGNEAFQQVIYERVSTPVQIINLSDQPKHQKNFLLEEFLVSDREKKFKLEKAPLFRAALITLDPEDHRLVLTFQHAIIDARSFMIFIRELISIYSRIVEQSEPGLGTPTRYQDYVEWIRQEDFSAAEVFWRKMFTGFNSPVQVDLADMSHDTLPAACGINNLTRPLNLTLPASMGEGLSRLCSENSITMNTLFQAAWGLLLSRYTRDTDIIFGATRSCRHSALNGETDHLIGPILNTLPFRLQINPEQPLIQFLQEVRQKWIAMRPYENTPLRKISAWSGLPGGQPLFTSICNFSNEDFLTQIRGERNVWKIHSIELFQQVDYPLTVNMVTRPDISIHLDYDARLYERRAASCLLSQLGALLENFSLHPESKVGEISMLSQAETNRTVVQWNSKRIAIPSPESIRSQIQNHAAVSPDHPAVIEGWRDQHSGQFRSLTNHALNERSNQLARYLLENGAGPEFRIGVCMERSMDYIVAFQAILKIGAVYVPLDPDIPKKRLAHMVMETETRLVLSHTRLITKLPDHMGNIIDCDKLAPELTHLSRENLDLPIDPNNLAYIIYTSGSTGKPKGVMITQQGLCNLMGHFSTNYTLNPEDRLLLQTPISFDPSIYDPLVPLLSGATIVLASPGRHADIDYIVETTSKMGITVWHMVTSLVSELLKHPKAMDCTSVRLLMTGGESIPADLPGKLARLRNIQTTNSYGPAETGIRAATKLLPTDEQWVYNSVGQPIENIQIYILDERMQPQPPGVMGEIYIGGSSVGRGYCRQPRITAERFVPDPFGFPGGRLYQTGDLGRYHIDGQIEFLGRRDHQIKLRGVRIEIEEIEHILNTHPLVARSGVSLHQGRTGPYLAAFIQTSHPENLDINEIRRYLRSYFSDHSLPASYTILQELPTLPSGKIDRPALNKLSTDTYIENPVSYPPQTNLENLLTRLFGQILGIEKVSLKDNFFNLGGHSLLVMRLMSLLNELFCVNLPMRTLFEAPTPAELRDILLSDPRNARRIEEIARLTIEAEDNPIINN